MAAVLEELEGAILDDDVERICGDFLAVQENRGFDNDNGGMRFCERDPLNEPVGFIERAGGEASFDLEVRDVSIERRGERQDNAEAQVVAGASTEVVSLRLDEGRWQIFSRDLYPGKPPAMRCRADGIVGLNARMGVVPRTRTPRQAALRGPFGTSIKRQVAAGGSFEIDTVTYSPDYAHNYSLRDSKGRIVSGYPVGVWKPGSFNASSKTFCTRDGQQGMVII